MTSFIMHDFNFLLSFMDVYVIDFVFFFQAEDGIRDVERSRGLEMCIRDRTTGVSGRENLYEGADGYL